MNGLVGSIDTCLHISCAGRLQVEKVIEFAVRLPVETSGGVGQHDHLGGPMVI